MHPIEAVLHALVGANDEVEPVALDETPRDVRAEEQACVCVCVFMYE